MRSSGLAPVEPAGLLRSSEGEAGAATALVRAGRRALAVEIQALVAPSEGPARRQATGLDPRRFQLVAAVLDRVAGLRLGRAELYGAVGGGLRLDDPGADLAIAAALTSAATGVAPPLGVAFVGELALTGAIRPGSGMPGRLGAARAAGLHVIGPIGGDPAGPAMTAARHLREALTWAFEPARAGRLPRSA
jgi:DNA repair protein RadA/Sms